MTSYTHHCVVHMAMGGWVTLGAVLPAGPSNIDLAEQWAGRIRSDTALWGPVVDADVDAMIDPGTPVVIPAASIGFIEFRSPEHHYMAPDPLVTVPAGEPVAAAS